MTERSIFLAALDIPDQDERAAYLDAACGGNGSLRRRIDELIAAEAKLGSFLDGPQPDERATAKHEPLVERPGVEIGPYKLLQVIGEGGMGVVYMAEQIRSVHRRVALKVVKPGMDSREVLARFEAERQALAMMDHLNIAKVLDAGATNTGRPYFVMELVQGIPITKYCDEHRLSPRQRLELFIPVCQAIQHAHQKGIIHRDIKPSNVLVCLYDGEPVPKVIDFGVAKAIEQRLTERTLFTQFGSIIGTFEYMSPEQAELSQLGVDTRSDIYSLGVLLYELLTGTTPLDRQRLRNAALDEMLRMIREEEPPKPSTRMSHMRSTQRTAGSSKKTPHDEFRISEFADLDWIVMKCLEKDRTRRYESANGLARDIQRYLADDAVEARPPSTIYRLTKFARRNRVAFVAGAVVAASLLAGLGTSTTLAIYALGQRNQARHHLADAQQQRAEADDARQTALLSKQVAEAERDRAEQAQQAEATQRKLAEAARESETARAQAEAEQRRRAEAAETAARHQEQVATTERDRAEQEKRIAQAVKEFLETRLLSQADAIQQANSLLQMGRTATELQGNPTIRELLDRAAAELTPEKIERQFPNLPLVQAEILRTIGQTYRSIGQTRNAVTHLERARDLYLSHLGPDHPEVTATLFRLTHAYYSDGSYAKSAELQQEVCAALDKRLGADHPDTLRAQLNLSWMLRLSGRLAGDLTFSQRLLDDVLAKQPADSGLVADALYNLASAYGSAGFPSQEAATLEQARSKRAAAFGPDHPDTVRTLGDLALAYRRNGHLRQCLELIEDAHQRALATLGASHPYTWGIITTKSLAYRDAGKLDDAIRLCEQVRDEQAAKLGLDHYDTLKTQWHLACGYLEAGKKAEAIRLLELIRDHWQLRFGADHPLTLQALDDLAAAYHSGNRLSEAIPLFEQVRDQRISKLGADHPDTLTTLNNLALAYRDAQRLTEALQLLQQARDGLARRLGEDDPWTLFFWDNLAGTYRQAGKLPEAIQNFEQVRDKRVAKLGPDHRDTLATFNNLALAYRDAGRLEEALQLLRHARDRRASLLGEDHPWTLTCWENMADIYRRMGKLPEAIQNLERILQLRVAKQGADHPNTINTKNALAADYKLAQRYPEAIALYEQVRDQYVADFGPEHPSTLSAQNLLGTAYWGARQLGKSVPLYEDLLSRRTKVLGPEHVETLVTKANLGVNYCSAGRLLEGLQLLQEIHPHVPRQARLRFAEKALIDNLVKGERTAEALAILPAGLARARASVPPGSLQLSSELVEFGRLLLDAKAWSDAEAVLSESLAIRARSSPDSWQVFYIKSLLGAALLGQQNYAQAEPLLIEGSEGMRQRIDRMPASANDWIRRSLERVVDLYTAWDKPAEAAKWQQALHEQSPHKNGKGSAP